MLMLCDTQNFTAIKNNIKLVQNIKERHIPHNKLSCHLLHTFIHQHASTQNTWNPYQHAKTNLIHNSHTLNKLSTSPSKSQKKSTLSIITNITYSLKVYPWVPDPQNPYQNILTWYRDGCWTREIKMRIDIAKEVFNRKISLLASKLNNEFKKKLDVCYVWSIALFGSEIWTLRKLKQKYWRVLKCGTGWEWRT